jgi:hypothetical protein
MTDEESRIEDLENQIADLEDRRNFLGGLESQIQEDRDQAIAERVKALTATGDADDAEEAKFLETLTGLAHITLAPKTGVERERLRRLIERLRNDLRNIEDDDSDNK